MENPLLDKPVKISLLTMAAPAAFGMLMTFLFQLVDSYFIGQLGTQELAAISYTYPVYIFIISLFMGISAGVSATVGRALGEKNATKAQSLVTISVLSFSALSAVLGVIGVFTMDNTFSLLGATSDSIDLIEQYMQPIYLGMMILVGGLIANSALMAKGIMIKTMVVMAFGGIVNVVFDYLLIFGNAGFPNYGLAGAAYATVISWAVILLCMLLLLLHNKLFSLTSIYQIRLQLKEILLISSPAVVAQILNPIAIAVITAVVSQYGQSAMAAFGIVTRIESLVLTGILALSVIVTPLTAQNYGAKAHRRLDNIIALSGRMTVYWGIAFGLLTIVFAESVIGIFSIDTEVIEFGRWYFYIVGATFPAFGLVLMATSFFNGVQQAKMSLRVTLVKSLLLTIPLAFIGGLFTIELLWAGVAVANILGCIYAKKLLDGWLTKNKSPLINRNPLEDYIRDVKGAFSRN